MSEPKMPSQSGHPPLGREQAVDRYAAVRQYSLAQILGVWAAAAVPMGVLAWIVAPLLRDQLGGDEPLGQALLICLTAGLVWQFVLVLILSGGSWGDFSGRACATPCGCGRPATRRPDAWAEGLVVGASLRLALRHLDARACNPRSFGEGFRRFHWHRPRQGLLPRRVGLVRGARRARRLQHRARRGASLPGVTAAAHAGRLWKSTGSPNGALFALYHLHQPWDIPGTFVDGIFLEAYPSRRFQSAWMGIIVHSSASVFALIVVLTLVLY